MLSDFRFAFRALMKTPGFTAAAILILALGIAANTAVFSVVEAVLLRALPYRHPEELVTIRSPEANQFGLNNVLEYCAYRDRTKSFTGLAAFTAYNTNLVDAGEAQLVQGVRVSANTFDVLGLPAAAGRLLTPDDDRPGAPKVAVLGYGLWQATYGGRQDVLGRSIMLNGEARTVVGVLPRDFLLPINGYHAEVCVPLQADADPNRNQPSAVHFLWMVGRIAPGMTREQVQADANAVLAQLRRDYPADFPGAALNPITRLSNEIVGDTRPILLTLLGIVGALLLLAAANLAGLLLVRGLGRQRELAIRSALGCSRGRLLRLLFAECLLLAVAGGIVGVFLAQWSLDGLLALIPSGVPRAHDVQFNVRIFGFTAVVSLVAGVTPGLAPLWLASRADLRETVGAGGRGSTAGMAQVRLRHFLAAVQIALALALLVCTGLFLRSFWALAAQRPGGDPAHVLTARLSLPQAGYRDVASLLQYYDTLERRVAVLPGIQAAGATSLLPLATGLATTEFTLSGQAVARDAERPSANYRLVTSDYFAALGQPMLQGRGFARSDDETHPIAIVVSQALAAKFFPEGNAIGKTLEVSDTAVGTRRETIVGVVANMKQGKMEDGPSYDIYVPMRQMDPVAVPWLRLRTFWVIRSAGPVATLEAAFRREVRAVDASVPVASVQTMDQVANAALAVRRFTLIVIGFLAAAAVVLTTAGVYATVAYGIAQRTREMGVRLALGATAAQIFRLVVGEGVALAAFGAVLGLAAAFGLSGLLASQLYAIGPRDPIALSGASALLFAVVFVACCVPARRAAHVDPMEAMRTD